MLRDDQHSTFPVSVHMGCMPRLSMCCRHDDRDHGSMHMPSRLSLSAHTTLFLRHSCFAVVPHAREALPLPFLPLQHHARRHQSAIHSVATTGPYIWPSRPSIPLCAHLRLALTINAGNHHRATYRLGQQGRYTFNTSHASHHHRALHLHTTAIQFSFNSMQPTAMELQRERPRALCMF